MDVYLKMIIKLNITKFLIASYLVCQVLRECQQLGREKVKMCHFIFSSGALKKFLEICCVRNILKQLVIFIVSFQLLQEKSITLNPHRP